MNMSVYEADIAWNWGIHCKFFKVLIHSYVVYSFLYFWLTVSNRLSKLGYLGNELKKIGLWGIHILRQSNPLKYSQKIVPIVFGFFLNYLNYCIKEGIKGICFCTLNLNLIAYEVKTNWNRGIPCIIYNK